MNTWLEGRRARIALIIISCGLQTGSPSSAQQPKAGRLTGHVVDLAGATIAGASVYVRKRTPTEDDVKLVAHTDGHGDFALTLPEGGYDILVTSPSFVSAVETVSIASDKTKNLHWKLMVLRCDYPGMNCDSFQ